MSPIIPRPDDGFTVYNYRNCNTCKKEIFIRKGMVPICDNCFAHRNDEPC